MYNQEKFVSSLMEDHKEMKEFGVFLLTHNADNDNFCTNLVKAVMGDVEAAKRFSSIVDKQMKLYYNLNNENHQEEIL